MRISLLSIPLALLFCLLPLSGRAQTERTDTLRTDSLTAIVAEKLAQSQKLVKESDSILKKIDDLPSQILVEESGLQEANPKLTEAETLLTSPGNTLYEFDEEALLEALSQFANDGTTSTQNAQRLNLNQLLSGSSSEIWAVPNDSTLYEVDEETLIETLRELAKSQRAQTRVGKKLSADELLRYQLLIQLLTRPNPQASASLDPIFIEVPYAETTTPTKDPVANKSTTEKEYGVRDALYALGTGIDAIGNVAMLSELHQNAAATNERLQALEEQQAALLEYLQQRDAPQGEGEAKAVTPVVFPSTKTIEVPADFKRSVFFLVGSATLTPQAEATLDEAIRFLQRFPSILFDLQGFASPDGSVQHNLQLGKARLDAVCRYLEANGIGAERLRTASYGQIDYASQRQLGRRVDISLIVP